MRVVPYESRLSAGKILVKSLEKTNKNIKQIINVNPDDFSVFAIPNGGVPVAEGFCTSTKISYELLIVRKIKIPYNSEAGFGSITTDGTILLNERLLSQLHLRKEQIENSIEVTKNEIQERLKFYGKGNISQNSYIEKVQNKTIFLIDDGLASGYTMLAAIKMIKSYKPIKLIIAIPTAPLRTIEILDDKVDSIICPNIRNTTWFAVADAYKNWYDVSESEVKEIIQKSQYYQK
jgi:predicted phosphoribosyltransferase